MKSETKVAIVKWAVEFVLFLFYLGLNYWLVDGNGWLIWFLSSAEWSGTIAAMRISENRKLFDISDRQLVHVSGLVDQLVERIDDRRGKQAFRSEPFVGTPKFGSSYRFVH